MPRPADHVASQDSLRSSKRCVSCYCHNAVNNAAVSVHARERRAEARLHAAPSSAPRVDLPSPCMHVTVPDCAPGQRPSTATRRLSAPGAHSQIARQPCASSMRQIISSGALFVHESRQPRLWWSGAGRFLYRACILPLSTSWSCSGSLPPHGGCSRHRPDSSATPGCSRPSSNAFTSHAEVTWSHMQSRSERTAEQARPSCHHGVCFGSAACQLNTAAACLPAPVTGAALVRTTAYAAWQCPLCSCCQAQKIPHGASAHARPRTTRRCTAPPAPRSAASPGRAAGRRARRPGTCRPAPGTSTCRSPPARRRPTRLRARGTLGTRPPACSSAAGSRQTWRAPSHPGCMDVVTRPGGMQDWGAGICMLLVLSMSMKACKRQRWCQGVASHSSRPRHPVSSCRRR